MAPSCIKMGSFYPSRKLLYCALLGVAFVCFSNLAPGHAHSHDHGDHGHAHDHAHSHEPPAQKYSKQANEDAQKAHGHGHAHDHGHSHEAHGHSHGHHGHSHDNVVEQPDAKADPAWQEKPRPASGGFGMWLKALTATAIISIAPVFILLVVPLENAHEHQDLLKVLLSFASGGLLGDAFLHLIPHAISPHSHGEDGGHEHAHSHDHGHSHGDGAHSHDMGVGLWVLGGIIAFLVVEKFVRYVKGGEGHGHSHGAPKPKKETAVEETPKKAYNLRSRESEKKKKAKSSDDDESESDDKKVAKSETASGENTDIKVAGYLNLVADFAHNFTDGLAIGASFLAGHNVGIITSVTIFFHEIPHEIGDFAILIQSGCSKKRAMLLQFSTALGAMMGTVTSLMMEGISASATAWILPFTAGGFIYIATVSVIPELLEDSKIKQSIKEIVALLLGVYMMVLIAQYE